MRYTKESRQDDNDGASIMSQTQSATECFQLGQQFSFRNERHSAVTHYTKAIERHPKFAEAYYNRGNCHHLLENYEQAVADFTEVIALTSHDPDKLAEAYSNRGASQYGRRYFKEAIADSTKAIELAPQSAEAHFNRGCCHHALGDYDEAIDDFTRIIAIAGKDPTLKKNGKLSIVYYKRGLCHQIQHNYDKGTADYTKAIKLNHENADAFWGRGVTRYLSDQKAGWGEDLKIAFDLAMKQENIRAASQIREVMGKCGLSQPHIP